MRDHEALTSELALTDQVAVVTGAGSGIGRATAQLLAANGAHVVCADLDERAAQETAQSIQDVGDAATAAAADVTQREQVDELVADTVARHGRLDAMCNIAGVMFPRPLLDLTDDELDRSLAVNLKAVVYGCQAAGRVMVARGRGAIVNMSSGTVDAMAPDLAAYSMAKAAVVQLTRSLAMEIGPHGVRVNVVSPGFILTGLTARHYTDVEGIVDQERLSHLSAEQAAVTPLRRVGQPVDVARTILFLLSDSSSFITGQIFRPNGGLVMPW